MIPRLEDVSIGHRIMLTFAIVVIVLLLLALVGYFSGGWDAEGAVAKHPPLIGSEETDPEISRFEADILRLDRSAMEKALVAHLQLLFTTWMKDYGAEGVETRVVRGANNGRKAYIKAMEAIERRQKKLEGQKK